MNKQFVLFAFAIVACIETGFTQGNHKTAPTDLLVNYYTLKDALVSGDAATAASGANELVKTLNDADASAIDQTQKNNLLKDAGAISRLKDISKQREKFASLSNNMVELAKTMKLSAKPVYQQYCPMKKASWLSSDKAIKNPYFGNAMLTCGSIKSTL